MKPMKFSHLAMLFVMVLSVWACKKSVEGETSKWEANKRQFSETRALYSGFGKAMDEQMEKAQKIWDQAQGATDEKAKIDKMAEANRLISGGWIGQLSKIDQKKQKIRKDIVRVKGMTNDPADRSAADAAASNAEQTIRDVDDRLRRGAISASQASSIVSNAYNNLEAALKNIDKVESTVKRKSKDAEKEVKEAKEEQKKQNADWKCSYCGKVNKASATECGGCGAPKSGI